MKRRREIERRQVGTEGNTGRMERSADVEVEMRGKHGGRNRLMGENTEGKSKTKGLCKIGNSVA